MKSLEGIFQTIYSWHFTKDKFRVKLPRSLVAS